MMTLEKTVDVTGDRKVHFDITLPEAVPQEAVQIIIRFAPAAAPEEELEVEPLSGADLELEPELQAILLSAAKKTAWRKAHPEEDRAWWESFRGCLSPGAFGGMKGVDYVRKIRDEWGD
jgi:hypothetical protein